MAMTSGKGMAIMVAVVLLAGIGSLAYLGVFSGLFKKSPAESAKAAGVVETADAVRIPLKTLDSGKALFLSLESEGRQLYYFALKSRDGAYRAALDACDVCYRTNRGYRQEGGPDGVQQLRAEALPATRSAKSKAGATRILWRGGSKGSIS